VVRNGHHNEREVITAAGPVRAPRVNDKRTDPATGERERFASAILPAWARKSPRVAEVLPNGHLVVSGEKQIGLNHNVDVLRFTGTVDPLAILPGSIVNSSAVANVRVESKGRGPQHEAQTVGWLTRFFLNVSPF